MDAWRIEIALAPEQPDPAGEHARKALLAAGLPDPGPVASRRGYLIVPDPDAPLDDSALAVFAREVLADPVVEEAVLVPPGGTPPPAPGHRLSVLLRPGVTDPVATSVRRAMGVSGIPCMAVSSYRAFLLGGGAGDADQLLTAAKKALANDVIQDVLADTWPAGLPVPAGDPDLTVQTVPLLELDLDGLVKVSTEGALALTGEEMQVIQSHFRELGRDPTQLELETLAQTWSEHCKHKTLTSAIRYVEDGQEHRFGNLLTDTIAHVTRTLDRDFCLSVFVDNAGVIALDEHDAVCIKVETHNHPSALEPFGGAGTGVGGVIRDVLGTGLAARPIANTDVFCFAPPDMPEDQVPVGCLHPMRIMRGVVAGVRDYGNPMGIPTVNGSIHFDEDFVGNPLVYVGNIGLLPRDKVEKEARPGDHIVCLGGRVGRDGIHGATFSSLELTAESEMMSSGAVQIGDPITERKVMDAVLLARDEDLFSCITDCGAGGLSSAVGEMAEELGAEVELSGVPLKYAGLSPWEVWISEAQERMVMAVPPEKLDRLLELCEAEEVEATVLGTFTNSGRLVVRHGGPDTAPHADMDLEFLHHGLPKTERHAVWNTPDLKDPDLPAESDFGQALCAVLADPGVASKEWVIRQYDHEVQAGSVVKPLVGVVSDGPADAAVIAPKPGEVDRLGNTVGVVISNGLVPRYSRIDPAAMAECALDEAMRNAVAVGADPDRIAVLDNYCWGSTKDPEPLGGLVRASVALRDLALTFRTPFVSGKDSLNNEFRDGDRLIRIPGCILVTALGVIPDIHGTFTSDLKRAGNHLVLIGETHRELGGSVYWKTRGELGASVPRVGDHDVARDTHLGVYRALQAGCAMACHDLSEGGLGAAAVEMAIGGRLGIELDLQPMPVAGPLTPEERLFSESQSRYLLEVAPDRLNDLAANLLRVPFAVVGTVLEDQRVQIHDGTNRLVNMPLEQALAAWQGPLDPDGELAMGRAARTEDV